MEKLVVNKELLISTHTEIYCSGLIRIDKIRNVSQEWLMVIDYDAYEAHDSDIYELTRTWQDNPYKVISEVHDTSISFVALDNTSKDVRFEDRLFHRKTVKYKKDAFLHQHLLREVSVNANVEILEKDVHYTSEKGFRCTAVYESQEH